MVAAIVPRRSRPERLFVLIGKRVRLFRLAAAFTQEEVVDASGEASGLTQKGHISSIEHGLVNPTVATLQKIADCLADPLDVELVDLVCFPESSKRHAVIALSRTLSEDQLSEILAAYGPLPRLLPQDRGKARNRAPRNRAEGARRRAR